MFLVDIVIPRAIYLEYGIQFKKSVLWSVVFCTAESWDSDSIVQEEIRSHRNVDLEKDGEN